MQLVINKKQKNANRSEMNGIKHSKFIVCRHRFSLFDSNVDSISIGRSSTGRSIDSIILWTKIKINYALFFVIKIEQKLNLFAD